MTLIVTAVAMLIISLTNKPYNWVVAASQLRKIENLRSHWSFDFVRNQLSRLKESNFGTGYPDDKLPEKYAGLNSPVYAEVEGQGDSHPVLYEINLPDKNWLERCAHCVEGDDNTEFPIDKVPPDSLHAFRWWWSEMIQGHRVVFPASISEGILSRGENRTRIKILPYSKKKRLIAPQNRVTVEIVWGENGNVQYRGLDEANGSEMNINVGQIYELEINSIVLAQYLGVSSSKPFEQSFADLVAVAKTKNIGSFSDLDETFSKPDIPDSPMLEVLGLRFPAETAFVGGPVVLLSLQLYLFIYLRRLVGKLKPDDSGWDVAWIGMDASTLARIVFFLTIVALPLLSLLMQVRNEYLVEERNVRGYGWYLIPPSSGPQLAFVLAAVQLSAFLGIRCWKYRPQMLPDSASSPEPPRSEPDYQI